MEKASVRDLHIRTSELVRNVTEGAVIVIERRGEPVAELRPVSKKRKVKLPRMAELWAKLPQLSGDATDIISEDRDRCI